MNRKNLSLFSLLLVFVFGHLSLSSQEMEAPEFKEIFDPFVGVWQGEYRIYSQQDSLLNQFKVNRNYWWDGAILMGRVSYDFGEVKQTYFHRIVLSDGMPFSFVTGSENPDEIKSALRGEKVKGTMVWNRVLPKETLPVRISERIVSRDNDRFIEFWGNQEAKDASGASMLVRIEGFLVYLPDSRDFVVKEEQSVAPVVEKVEAPKVEKPVEVVPDPVVEKPVKTEKKSKPTPPPAAVEKKKVVEKRNEKKVKKAQVKKPEPVKKQEPVEKSEPEVKKEEPKPAPKLAPKASIEEDLSTLNIVGINDRPGEVCIVVDYFLLYKPGDRIETEEACFFTRVDADYLYFEDLDGYTYRIPRKDK